MRCGVSLCLLFHATCVGRDRGLSFWGPKKHSFGCLLEGNGHARYGIPRMWSHIPNIADTSNTLQ